MNESRYDEKLDGKEPEPEADDPTTQKPTIEFTQTTIGVSKGIKAELTGYSTAVYVMWETYEGATEYRLYTTQFICTS